MKNLFLTTIILFSINITLFSQSDSLRLVEVESTIETLNKRLSELENENKQLGNSVNDLQEKLSNKRIETGEVDEIGSDTWKKLPNKSSYVFSKKVKFKSKFNTTPEVVCTLNLIDSDKDANLRVHTWASDITPASFTLNIRKWADTKLYRIKSSYVAYTN